MQADKHCHNYLPELCLLIVLFWCDGNRDNIDKEGHGKSRNDEVDDDREKLKRSLFVGDPFSAVDDDKGVVGKHSLLAAAIS